MREADRRQERLVQRERELIYASGRLGRRPLARTMTSFVAGACPVANDLA
jgi:hypothetical protein